MPADLTTTTSLTARPVGLSKNCLRTSKLPRPCSNCGAALNGSVAHLPLYARGIFCARCCPSCNSESGGK
jgi:hypothetical protein